MIEEPLVWPLRHSRQDPLRFLRSLSARGDVVPFTVGRRRAVLLAHPTHIEVVLGSDHDRFAKGPGFTRAKRVLGDGLLTAEGETHRRRRQIIQPAFHRASMDRYGEGMVRRAVALSEQWSSGTPIDVCVEMQRLTLAIVGEALFGAEFDDGEAAQIRRAIAAVASNDPLASLLAPARRARSERQRLHAIVTALIARRLQSPAAADDLLALLISADHGQPPPSKQLHDDVLTMLLAGHDTIASALTWSWILLARHPHMEDRLHAELNDVLAGRMPTPGDVEALRYTRAIFAECLRLFPPASILTRLALSDCELDGATTATIAAGSLVVISQYLVHRDPRFFDDPLAFDPARWLSSPARGSRPKLAYFPFGAGPRACVGEGFAWTEGVLVLAVLAQRWRIRPAAPESVESEMRVTLRPKPPVVARLEPRR